MVIVEIIGGLGNQMFQYAFKMAYDATHSEHALININTFDTYKVHKYQLNVFNIDDCVASPKQVIECRGERRKLCYKFPFGLHHQDVSNIVTEKIENVYEPELLNKRGDVYYVGYFQTEKYFQNIRPDVLRAFSLKVPLDTENNKMLENIRKTNAVSLHVRRGDYVGLANIYGTTDLDYYKRAIEYIQSRVENPHFFVFSNDIAWCQDNLGIKSTFVDINNGDTGYFDLELMRNCKHNIITNSTFSWWGAWLNENSNKIVVSPHQWFADGRPTDIIPDSWIKI